MKQKLHNPIGLIIPWLISFMVFFIYAFYWKNTAKKIEETIMAQKGKSFDFSHVDVEGFPVRFSVKLKNFTKPILGQNLQIDEINATTRPLSPQLWVIDKVTGISLNNSANQKTDIIANNLLATIHFNYGANLPRFQRISIEIANLNFKNGENTKALNNLKIHFLGDAKNNAYGFSFEGQGLGQLEPFSSAYVDPQILRGLIINANSFDTSFENWKNNNGQIAIKYGVVKLNKWGIFNSGDFTNLNGNINFDSQNNANGIIDNAAQITIFSGNKINIPNFKIYVSNSKIDIQKSLSSIDLTKISAN